jgi:methyl-accepting chemotaxis protein
LEAAATVSNPGGLRSAIISEVLEGEQPAPQPASGLTVDTASSPGPQGNASLGPSAAQQSGGEGVGLLERQRRAAELISSSIARRWLAIGLGIILLGIAARFGLVALSGRVVMYVAGAAVVANLIATAAARRWRQRWAAVNGLMLFDMLLVSTLVVLLGAGGLIVLFFLAVFPYTFERRRLMGDVVAGTAALMFILALIIHGYLIATPRFGIGELSKLAYVEAAVFFLVAAALRRKWDSLMTRLRAARALMGQAEKGALNARAQATRWDELGYLERSFNRMLDQLGAAVSTNQQEADEAAILAEVIAQAAHGVLASTESVALTAGDLAREMSKQRELAEGGRRESTDAAQQAESLRDRAARIELDARQLVEAANMGRERVGRAGETLLAIGEDVRTTASTVQELNRRSERIGEFAQAISRIARQTHLLALNAAIEAAHSKEGSEGFAAVANEVRILAAEAAQSAREVDELIGDVQARIDAVARAMASGEEKVGDVGIVAAEAQAALEHIHTGVSQVTELVADTAGVSRAQAERMAQLAQKMGEVAAISTRSAEGADQTAAAMAAQQSTIGDLNAISSQLADLAERVQASAARFSAKPSGSAVVPPDIDAS